MELLNQRAQPGLRRADCHVFAMPIQGWARNRNRSACAGVLLVTLLVAWCALSSAEDLQSGNEYQVKALFLYNFAKFVEWPSAMSGGPICIGVLGDDPFGDALDRTIEGKTVNGRGFVVKRLKSEAEARQCHIVFVNLPDKKRLRSLLDTLKGAAVLTVGETRGFAEGGGVINFVVIDDRVRFEANMDAAEQAGLKLSSKLLSLAKIVHKAGS